VLPAVITRPAAEELPSTGGRLAAEITLALLGIGVGAGVLRARRWHDHRVLESATGDSS
jgi:hypothetical protein